MWYMTWKIKADVARTYEIYLSFPGSNYILVFPRVVGYDYFSLLFSILYARYAHLK